MKAISIENISKKYILSHKKKKYQNLKESVSGFFGELFTSKDEEETKEVFWALRNVSFDIEQGDRIGWSSRVGVPGPEPDVRLGAAVRTPAARQPQVEMPPKRRPRIRREVRLAFVRRRNVLRSRRRRPRIGGRTDAAETEHRARPDLAFAQEIAANERRRLPLSQQRGTQFDRTHGGADETDLR
jgi:hypothetical protein